MEVVATVIYSSMLGMTVFALLENQNKPKQRQTRFLSGLFVLLLIHVLGELYIFTGFYQYAPILAGLQIPVRMLLGPALYFFAYATMSPEKSLPKKAYWLSLLGPVLVIAAISPFLFGISSEEKLALASPATRDPELWKIAVFACTFGMLIFIVFTGVYLLATLRMHSKHRAQLLERFSSIEKRSMDWFRGALFLWGGAWLLYATEYLLGFMGLRWFGTGIVLPTVEALVLLVFAHMAIRQPVLKESERGPAQAVQPKTYNLTESRMQEYANALHNAMEQDKLFLEEDLSLKRLSEAINVSENHISETLSQFLNSNFFLFVNGYRVEAAKQLLKSTDKQVATVAYESGFNSKSTFNNVFKKTVGTTPTAFRKQQEVQ